MGCSTGETIKAILNLNISTKFSITGFDNSQKMIELAKESGANAIKFQTYKAEKIASYKSPYYWDLKKVSEKSQYKLFKKYDKSRDDSLTPRDLKHPTVGQQNFIYEKFKEKYNE